VQMNNFKIHSRDQFLRAATSVIPPDIPDYEQVVTVITECADRVPEVLEKMFPKYVTEESYMKALKELDEDGDGKIEKKEFLGKFIKAQSNSINMAALSMELTMELMPNVQEVIMSALLDDESGMNIEAMLSSDDEEIGVGWAQA